MAQPPQPLPRPVAPNYPGGGVPYAPGMTPGQGVMTQPAFAYGIEPADPHQLEDDNGAGPTDGSLYHAYAQLSRGTVWKQQQRAERVTFEVYRLDAATGRVNDAVWAGLPGCFAPVFPKK